MLKSTERRAYDARFAALWGIDPKLIIAESSRHKASITEVKMGGVLRFENTVFVVTNIATYTETDKNYTKPKDYVSTELTLFSLATGETRYLEWEEDDGVAISVTERKLKRSEFDGTLYYDDGDVVDLDDLAEIVDDEEDIVFEGETYSYDDDYPVRYVSHDGRTGNVYLYEFCDQTESSWFTIEAWQEEDGGVDFEVYISYDIPPAEVEIISLG